MSSPRKCIRHQVVSSTCFPSPTECCLVLRSTNVTLANLVIKNCRAAAAISIEGGAEEIKYLNSQAVTFRQILDNDVAKLAGTLTESAH